MVAATLSLGVPQTANAPGVRLTRWALKVPVAALAFTRDATHAAFALTDGTVRLVPLRQFGARKMAAAVLHQGAVLALCTDCVDSGLLSAGADGRVVLVDSDGFAADLVESDNGPVGPVAAAAAGSKGWRAVADGAEIHLFDRDGRRYWRLDSEVGPVSALGFRHDGQRLAAAGANGLAVWRLDCSGATVLPPHQRGAYRSLAWSPRGDRLAAIDIAGLVTCWPLGDGGPEDDGPCLGKANALAWSADGRYLVGGGHQSMAIWPVAGGANGASRAMDPGGWGSPFCLGMMAGSTVTAVACHPAHDLAAAGYDDGCILLADLGQQRDLLIKHAEEDAIVAIAWSSAGDFLATATATGEAAIFDFTALTRRKTH